MSISFDRKNGELLLHYKPEAWDVETFIARLKSDGERTIAHCFTVSMDLMRVAADEEECCFCIGKVQDDYTLIDRSVINTEHRFYLANDIKLSPRYFVADQNIAILQRIDDVVDSDVYIGGKRENAVPAITYEHLLKCFPKKAEMRRYAYSRIATILKEHFPGAERHEKAFQHFLDRKDNQLAAAFGKARRVPKVNAVIEYNQLVALRDDLKELLDAADGIPEAIWQQRIHGILRFLYPQYIIAAREIAIQGVDKHDKRPDFLLVDVNGYVHILEIKKPGVQLLTKQSSYRNNYVPVRELAGAIQQIDKYILCLNKWGAAGEENLEKQLQGYLPEGLSPKIVSPQGLLLLGRSKDFNAQQRDDFELVRRSHKQLTDILTYDDMLMRLDNSIKALRLELKNDCAEIDHPHE